MFGKADNLPKRPTSTKCSSSVALNPARASLSGSLSIREGGQSGSCPIRRSGHASNLARALENSISPLQIPKHIDYELWCGPAEKRELYRPKLHYDWHWDFNTGNGDMGNQGIHQMDIARWFLGYETISPRVLSIGGRLGYEDAGDTPNTQTVIHDYPGAAADF